MQTKYIDIHNRPVQVANQIQKWFLKDVDYLIFDLAIVWNYNARLEETNFIIINNSEDNIGFLKLLAIELELGTEKEYDIQFKGYLDLTVKGMVNHLNLLYIKENILY